LAIQARRANPTQPSPTPSERGLLAGTDWQCKGCVAPRSRPKLGWQNSQLLGDDIVASLKKLAQDGPELLVQGSSDLLQTLWKEGLVDELSVRIFPVVLGKGKRLFGNGARPAGLKLVKSQSFPTGVIVANYQPASEVKTGDFQLAEPTEAELERRRNLTRARCPA
jgi:dihydrofolate reductase